MIWSKARPLSIHVNMALYSYSVIIDCSMYRQGRPPVEYHFYPDFKCQTLQLSVKYSHGWK